MGEPHLMTRILRDYQKDAIAHLKAEWAAGLRRVPMVLATGAGKTEIFTDPTLLDDFLGQGKRVLIIVHTDELAGQALKKARRNNPGRRVGLVMGQTNQPTSDIVVASRQTLLSEKRRNQIRNVGLIIIDEAHHATRHNTYGKILDHYGAFDGVTRTEDGPVRQVLVAGFTATLARGDKEKLSEVWQAGPGGKVFSRDILYFIRRGFLLDVRGERVVVPDFDMRNVRTSGGDLRGDDLADELERTFAPEIVAREYKARAVSAHDGSTRKGIAFWPLVSTSEHGAKAFNDLGIRSEVIHGNVSKLSKGERRAMLQRLHTGETQVIHGVAVLTEGFDEPTVDVVVMARPTRSAPLYQQCVGRVLRPNLEIPAAMREKALILDVTGASASNDLRSLIDLAPDRKREGVEVDPGDSLLQIDEEWLELLAEERASGQLQDFAEEYVGDTKVVEFDPLGRANVWSKTPAGVWFIGAGDAGYAFLVPSIAGEPSHFDVVLCSKLGWAKGGVQPWARATEYVDLPMDMALGWAEEEAVRLGGAGTKSLIGKKSKWRKEEPSNLQKVWAYRRGINVAGMTKGELTDLRNNIDAADRIDPLAEHARRMAEQTS